MPPLNVKSVADALVDELRERILSSELPPGEPVTEAYLCKEFDVARTSARAAIERLCAEGLLQRDAHRSARVPVVSPDAVWDIYFAREVIEGQAYRVLAARNEVPASAVEAQQDMTAAIASANSASVVDADIAFHRALVDALQSPRTTAAHSALWNEMRLCMSQVQLHHLLDPKHIFAEHAGILTAIRAGDPAQAADLGSQHLARARDLLSRLLNPE